jgi:hypothetical protein
MSDDKGAGGADDQNPGGNEPDPADNTQNNKVAYETYKKVLDEKKSMQKRLEDLDKKAKADAEAQLKEKEQYRELYEAKQKELEDLSGKLSAKEKETQDYRKMGAFLKSVAGEIPQQYWGLIDLDKIAVDDSGKIDDNSVKKCVKDFEKAYPHVIERKSGNKMPNNAANGGGGALSYEEWVKLPYDEKRKRQKDVQLEG